MSRFFMPVIDAGCSPVDQRNYVLENALGDTSGDLSVPATLAGAAVFPDAFMGDGRVSAARSSAYEPEDQPAWGWGLARAVPQEEVSAALTELPSDPYDFTDRQQDAVRRDLAWVVGNYTAYAPVPFAAQDPLTFDNLPAFDAYAAVPATLMGSLGLAPAVIQPAVS